MAKTKRRSGKPVKCRYCTWVMRPHLLYGHVELRHPEHMDEVKASLAHARASHADEMVICGWCGVYVNVGGLESHMLRRHAKLTALEAWHAEDERTELDLLDMHERLAFQCIEAKRNRSHEGR